MEELELLLVDSTETCTIYTIHFISKEESEYEQFYNKIKAMSEYNEDFEKLLNIIGRIMEFGAFERYFRPEGKMRDKVCALPVEKSKLRLYCLRLSDRILILGNGGVKKTQAYNEDSELEGYVFTLQKLDSLLSEYIRKGIITVTENTIKTSKPLMI